MTKNEIRLLVKPAKAIFISPQDFQNKMGSLTASQRFMHRDMIRMDNAPLSLYDYDKEEQRVDPNILYVSDKKLK